MLLQGVKIHLMFGKWVRDNRTIYFILTLKEIYINSFCFCTTINPCFPGEYDSDIWFYEYFLFSFYCVLLYTQKGTYIGLQVQVRPVQNVVGAVALLQCIRNVHGDADGQFSCHHAQTSGYCDREGRFVQAWGVLHCQPEGVDRSGICAKLVIRFYCY